MSLSPLALFACICAALAAAILLGYLAWRPSLTAAVKLWLLLGLGVLPLSVALAGNVEGFHSMKQREFCGSCHVMSEHERDSEDRSSGSLASRHARNRLFGEENCYVCHADYGMFGAVATKLGGLGHVWYYYTDYHDVPLDEARKTIRLRRPYPNENCMQCHSTRLEVWNREPDHRAALEDVRSGKVSCASQGCHGQAHPFFKAAAAAASSGAPAVAAPPGASP